MERSLLSIGLLTFEAFVGIANFYNNSGEMPFRHEDCENISK
jgi:hypothetical protein